MNRRSGFRGLYCLPGFCSFLNHNPCNVGGKPEHLTLTPIGYNPQTGYSYKFNTRSDENGN